MPKQVRISGFAFKGFRVLHEGFPGFALRPYFCRCVWARSSFWFIGAWAEGQNKSLDFGGGLAPQEFGWRGLRYRKF